MSNDDQNEKRGTTTTTKQTTEVDETAEEVLTPEEEKVVRARHGLDEDGDHELSFGLGASEEAKEKMARLEEFLVGAFQEREQGKVYFSDVEGEGPEPDDAEAKNKIVEALSNDD